jgi:hypothetical protein
MKTALTVRSRVCCGGCGERRPDCFKRFRCNRDSDHAGNVGMPSSVRYSLMLDSGEHTANNPAWTSRIASPITRLWLFAFVAAFALERAPIGLHGLPRSMALSYPVRVWLPARLTPREQLREREGRQWSASVPLRVASGPRQVFVKGVRGAHFPSPASPKRI